MGLLFYSKVKIFCLILKESKIFDIYPEIQNKLKIIKIKNLRILKNKCLKIEDNIDNIDVNKSNNFIKNKIHII